MHIPMFRDLTADEIEVRVAQVTPKGVSLLLYKDARVDQNILDETVGCFNWMRSHSRDNANCTVFLWDESKQQWISKEDTGVESNTEKEKGLASDSFKRACFNWGIGRELYTAPFVWVKAEDCKKHEQKDGKWKCFDCFAVESISIKEKRIVELVIRNLTTKAIVFSFPNGNKPNQEDPKQTPKNQQNGIAINPDATSYDLPDRATLRKRLITRLAELNIPTDKFAESHNINANSTAEDFMRCLKELG